MSYFNGPSVNTSLLVSRRERQKIQRKIGRCCVTSFENDETTCRGMQAVSRELEKARKRFSIEPTQDRYTFDTLILA